MFLHDASELIRAIASLAWPIFALVLVLRFRRQLVGLLATAGPLRRAKAGPTGVELHWERQVAEAEFEIEAAGLGTTQPKLDADLEALARVNPMHAVWQASVRLEEELRERLKAEDVSLSDLQTGLGRLALLAAERGLISRETERALEGIAVLRNMTAHGVAADITPKRALDFLRLVDAVSYAIRNAPSGG